MSRDDGPAAKRRRLSPTGARATAKPAVNRSRIFAPFRTVGLVSPTPIPFTATAQGKTTFQITTSAGRCLQTFDLRKGLQLIFITRPQTPGPITATAVWADRVLAGWASTDTPNSRGVWIFKRGKQVGKLEIPEGWDENIVQIVVFGSWIIGCCTTKILVWASKTCELHTTLYPPFGGLEDGRSVLTGGICNMPTFLNKIFAGREDGRVEIWNVSTGKLVYTVQPPSSESGAVTALQPTPALSLLAIAYMSGQVIISDVQADANVIVLSAGKGEHSPVTSISFRTDGLGAGSDGREAGIMATASFNSGDVILWDLNNGGKKVGTLRGAHNQPSDHVDGSDGGISKAEFLPNQAILLTSGLDNSLKSWIFDEVPFSPIPRILHSRSGHANSITTLNFLPSDADGADAGGKWILSTGQDRSLWGWSLRRDAQSTELSQGNVKKKAKALGALTNGAGTPRDIIDSLKAPPITCLACSLNRDGGIGALPGTKALWATAKQMKGKSTATEQSLTGWESIVTGHLGDKFARTWFWGRKRAGRWILETGDGGEVKSVAISSCGTFALLGSAIGGIDMYNLQSGHHRQRFPAKLTPAQAKAQQLAKASPSNAESNTHQTWAKGHGRHSSAVTGIEVDSLNRNVISCGADGKIKFWDFMTGLLIYEIDWSHFTAILGMRYHRSSDLVALKCDDYCIRLIDIETKKLVREIRGPDSDILDYCFSNDGRWIVSSSKDSTIRVWDLPTGHLIDIIRLHSPCTALAFSNTGEYLATTLQDSVGIDIWTNRTLFKHVPTRSLTESQAQIVEEPTASGEGGEGILASAFEEDEFEDADLAIPDDVHEPLRQLSTSVETLSLVPRSRWQTLVHLDLIRERNKPIQPPKPPEKLPFFLSSALQSSAPSEDTKALQAVTPDPAERSRIAKLASSSDNSNTFTTLLHAGAAAADYEPFITHLKTLPPSATDIQIRSLSVASAYAELRHFVDALTERLLARRDYELVQAWMAVFLRVHGELLTQDDELDEEDAEAMEDSASGVERLRNAVAAWRAVQREEAKRLNNLVGYCRGVIGFLRGAT